MLNNADMNKEKNRFTDEALKEVMRRAAWDAVHGEAHLRRGRFFASAAEVAAARRSMEKLLTEKT